MIQKTAVAPGRVGVVTVTYNSAEVLAPFLAAVGSQTCLDFLLYVVDNASRDTTLEQLATWQDARLRVIANPDNRGIAEGNNQGIRAALADGCECVLLLNNDVEFAPETFATLLAEMSALDSEIVAPKILYGDGQRIWSAGAAFNPAKGYLGYHIGQGELDHGQYDTVRPVQFSPACCLLVRKSVFEAIGMMDPKYFVYHDDLDFCFRALRSGVAMFYTPKAVIVHKVSSLTGGPDSKFTIRYNTRGHVYFMLKNLGVLRCLYFLPALQARLLSKLILREIRFTEYSVRQRALLEGIRVWLSAAS